MVVESGSCLEINPANANTTVTVTDDRAFSSGSYLNEINVATIVFVQDATGGRTLTVTGAISSTPNVDTTAKTRYSARVPSSDD